VTALQRARSFFAVVALACLVLLPACAEPEPTASAQEVVADIACVPPAHAEGPPPAKPVPATRNLRPLGPLGDGHAVALSAFDQSGLRQWWCSLDPSGEWHGIPVPDGISSSRSATDGQAIALGAHFGNDERIATDSVVLAAPAQRPRLVRLTDAADRAWLDDWSFWGSIEPMPAGGFLLARGTRLALIQDGNLSFRPMPSGLIPIAPTSDPTTWVVASANGRVAGGDVRGPWMLWHEGDADPVPIDGSWSRWLPASGGLVWLRGTNAWALLDADRSVVGFPPDDAARYGSDLAPDGSAALLTSGSDCGSDAPGSCHVAIVDPRSGSEEVLLPGPGAISWGTHDALFVTQPNASTGLAPQALRIADGVASKVALP
jgi:hypothetical protein